MPNLLRPGRAPDPEAAGRRSGPERAPRREGGPMGALARVMWRRRPPPRAGGPALKRR